MTPQAHPHNVNGQQPAAGIGLDEVYFTIFRHKKILVACLCLGFAGALAVRLIAKPLYTTEAKLLVRYVVNTVEINPANQGTFQSPDAAGDSIMTSEVEILNSLDLSKQVAEAYGPEKILAKKGGGTNVLDAAGVVASGITAFTSRRSDVMILYFSHPDPEVVQPVLGLLIQAYLRRHQEVRMTTAFGEKYYSDQVNEIRKKLSVTEEELKKVLTQAKVISIEDAKRSYSTQVEKLRNELNTAKADLYARKAALGESPQPAGNTNSPPSTIPSDKLDLYANVLAGLDTLRKEERQLILKYTEAHPLVSSRRESIAQLREKKAELEKEYPGLMLSENTSSGVDLSVERAQIRALAARVEGYESYLTNLQDEALNLLTVEPKIAELKRQQEQEEKNFQYVVSSLDRARASETSGNKVTGISTVEEPTPPVRTNRKTRKTMVAVFGAFLALGFGIAALIDFVLDRTIKRSADVRRHMRLPFFLAIPDTCWTGRIRLPRLPFNKPPRTGGSEEETASNGAVTAVMPPWDPNHHLRLYAEGLRERLITYFEVNGINHKPKLVGVTSCGGGAGVTTLASGVAAALSKTGEGNVLLVDMNGGQGATHSFYKGKPGGGLADALEPDARAETQVQENLYLVSLRSSDTPNTGTSDTETLNKLLPSRLNKFMPQLKASDYDYVIFDMPPVTPTSVTPRLGSNMDMVLLVLESEKTAQHAAGQAGTLLADARVNAAVVLNKCRQHVPSILSQEL